MKRRNFLETMGWAGTWISINPFSPNSQEISLQQRSIDANYKSSTFKADLVVAGGGLGGVAAALASLRNGWTVILTEETDWIGGQLTQQGVPPDEHRWIESKGATASYRNFRNRLRDYYKRNYPLLPAVMESRELNPGNGAVSRLCAEPRAGVSVLTEMLAPYISNGQLRLMLNHKITEAVTTGHKVDSLKAKSLLTGQDIYLIAPWFVDATELGDLLPLTGTAYVTGTESKTETGELHAPDQADPQNQQAFTLCFAMEYRPGENHIIDRPEKYNFWSNYIPKITPAWPGRLLDLTYSKPGSLEPKKLGFDPEGNPTGDALNLWNYRKMIDRKNFTPGFYPGDISLVNWPQNDYLLGNLVDVTEKEFRHHVEGAKQLNISLLYWLQTEVPRADGGQGWPGLRIRHDVMGTADGMAKYPYVREARRIKAQFTILEEHVGVQNRTLSRGKQAAEKAEDFFDSVGIGSYYLDLHPSSKGNNYIDLPSLPFEIPLGALIPKETENLFPAAKNIGTTHITNGCYRLHPVEWNIGEAVGLLLVFSDLKKVKPSTVRSDATRLSEFQQFLGTQGVPIKW